MMQYRGLCTIRVAIANPTPGAVEPDADTLARLGAIEAALEPFAVALSSFEADGGATWTVEALCDGAPDLGAVRRALRDGGLGGLAPSVAPVADRDWVAHAQAALPPLRAGRFFVHGSHFAGRPPRGSIALRIDPGLAFGTGHHETTRGCLLALDRLARECRFTRPLDLGCGSGILALAMARLFEVEVLAADNDPKAVAVTRENARLNRLGHLVRAVRSDGYAAPGLRRRAPFDLVTANILAGPLVRLAGDLSRHLGSDGVAILSGLLRRQEAEVLAAHRAHALALAWSRRLGDWSVLVLRRP